MLRAASSAPDTAGPSGPPGPTQGPPPRRESRGRAAVALRRLALRPAAAPLALAAAGAAGAAYLWQTNPHEPGHWLPRCPFNWATGLLCPACGATRMVYDAMHGDAGAALADNAAMLLIGVPFAAWLYGRWLYEGLRGRRWRPAFGRRGVVALLGAAVAWAVVRNVVG